MSGKSIECVQWESWRYARDTKRHGYFYCTASVKLCETYDHKTNHCNSLLVRADLDVRELFNICALWPAKHFNSQQTVASEAGGNKMSGGVTVLFGPAKFICGLDLLSLPIGWCSASSSTPLLQHVATVTLFGRPKSTYPSNIPQTSLGWACRNTSTTASWDCLTFQYSQYSRPAGEKLTMSLRVVELCFALSELYKSLGQKDQRCWNCRVVCWTWYILRASQYSCI